MWSVASPIEHIKTARILPPICLVNAQFDMGLELGAKTFMETLTNGGFRVNAHVVPATSHGSVSRTAKTVNIAVEFMTDIMYRELLRS
jgi:hypothetical protein